MNRPAVLRHIEKAARCGTNAFRLRRPEAAALVDYIGYLEKVNDTRLASTVDREDAPRPFSIACDYCDGPHDAEDCPHRLEIDG